MHICLVSMLKRNMASSFLKQFRSPSKLCKKGEYRMAKRMGGCRYSRLDSQSSKERVYICIGHGLAASFPGMLEKQMVRLNLGCMRPANVSNDLINEIRRDIDRTQSAHGFDLGSIF